jgi:hypothetical protein
MTRKIAEPMMEASFLMASCEQVRATVANGRPGELGYVRAL